MPSSVPAQPVTTQAQRLLTAPISQVCDEAVRTERLDNGLKYTFADGSAIHIRKLSGRSAFARNGWHLAST
jgi:hypothetical protein